MIEFIFNCTGIAIQGAVGVVFIIFAVITIVGLIGAGCFLKYMLVEAYKEWRNHREENF